MIFDFPKRLIMLRERKGWSQQNLAARAGVSDSAIGQYERDISLPTLQKAATIADALDVSLDYLAEGEKSRTLSLKGLTDEQVQLLTDLVIELKQTRPRSTLLSTEKQLLLARLIQQFVQY